jgi:hypothetical protein
MTVLDKEFDDEFIGWMFWLAEQRSFRESGLPMDTETFERLDKLAMVELDTWFAERQADAIRKEIKKGR